MTDPNVKPAWLQPALNAALQAAVLAVLALGNLDAEQLQILGFVLSGSWMAKSAVSAVRGRG
jgi:hypothetical protein